VARHLVVFTFVAALAVFCVVQDRVTAAGATQYGEAALEAIARHEAVPRVDTVMRPAIRRSVWLGLASAGPVLAVGLGSAAVVSRRRARRRGDVRSVRG
jgi:ABC-type Fe3+ transport system permease subunit